jgi:NitT/TauT family transport system substrate-binding protein
VPQPRGAAGGLSAASSGGAHVEEEHDVRLDNLAQRLGALALISVLIVGCTAAATPVPTTAPAPTSGATSGASSPTAATGELPKPEKTSIKIGMAAGGEISTFAQIQASQLKLFEKYGLNVELISFEGSGKAVGALQAGQTDMGTIDFGSTLSSQLTDVPLVAVAANATILTDDLVCLAAIKTAADVKGKRVAISTFGGTSHAAALLSLKALDLKSTDAAITQIGGQSARIAALKGGSIECGIIDKNASGPLVAEGMNVVAKVYEPPQPFGRSAFIVRKDFFAQNPNTVLVAVAASLEGQNLIWTDVPGSAQRWAQWAQTDVAKATPLVTEFQTVGNRSLNFKDEAFVNAQKVIATVNPDIIDVKISDAYDRGPLEKLVQLGFYAKIGNPVTTP